MTPPAGKYGPWRLSSNGTRWECRHWVADATGKRSNLYVSIPLDWTESDVQAAMEEMDAKVHARTDRPYGFGTAEVVATSIRMRQALGALSQGTAEKYEGMLRTHIAPAIGAKRPEDVTPWDVSRLLADAVASGLSVSSACTLHAMLSGTFKWMVANGVVESNPVAGADKPRAERREAVFASEADHRAMARWAADETDADPDGRMLRDIVYVLMNTGLRVAELSALKVTDFDPEGMTLRVERAVKQGRGKWRVGPPKSKESRRTVELSADACARIARHVAWQDARFAAAGDPLPDGAWMFSRDRETPWLPTRIRERWRTARAKLGVDGRITPHSMRHMHVTVAVAAGANIREVQERIGHSDPMTTARVYTHVLPDRRGEVARRAAELERGYLDGA